MIAAMVDYRIDGHMNNGRLATGECLLAVLYIVVRVVPQRPFMRIGTQGSAPALVFVNAVLRYAVELILTARLRLEWY